MINVIHTQKPLSSNPEVRRQQVIEHINNLRDIWNNQKYSNDIMYDFNLLRNSIDHYKKRLDSINVILSSMYTDNNQYFLPID